MCPGYSSPPDQNEFRNHVWEIVRQIPPGKVATYGQIAALVPALHGLSPQSHRAFGPRWVGGAMAACPENVPWHRVINAQGKISVRGGSENVQRQLLEAEGVMFDSRDRINLCIFGWTGSQNSKE
jgi:methylated-DNA-protein-cysteine methyltransferase-like protein